MTMLIEMFVYFVSGDFMVDILRDFIVYSIFGCSSLSIIYLASRPAADRNQVVEVPFRHRDMIRKHTSPLRGHQSAETHGHSE